MSVRVKWGLLGLFTVLSALISLTVGALPLSPSEFFLALIGAGEPTHRTIVHDIRLPRTLLALLIGAGLGASGAALQSYTRNPLADPGILGFSAMAALGAVIALYFGQSMFVTPGALIGAGLGALLILAIAGRQQGSTLLVLAGVGVGSLATALTGLIMNFAPNPWALSEIVYWLMGSLRNASWTGVGMCAGLTLAGLAALFICAIDFRTLSLGEDTAKSLGVSLSRVRFLTVVGVALCVGSGVAIAGAIGFIGLFVPHILRGIFGPDPARLLPLSAIGGAGFLALADTLTRLLSTQGTILYLGILTALIGAPFFIWLAVKEKLS
ncbi:MAG: iron ABC transporter permease [Acidimicrobiales bacterium]|nr:iron ABC transporter permease [Hyphomonadaceae bacterium]RZV44978.1 MAG: iron ABC transporter permease [Acidimicrobiales bacterium]